MLTKDPAQRCCGISIDCPASHKRVKSITDPAPSRPESSTPGLFLFYYIPSPPLATLRDLLCPTSFKTATQCAGEGFDSPARVLFTNTVINCFIALL